MQAKLIRGTVLPAPRKLNRKWTWPRGLRWLPRLGRDAFESALA